MIQATESEIRVRVNHQSSSQPASFPRPASANITDKSAEEAQPSGGRMGGFQVGADLSRVVVSSNSNSTRDATGGRSRERDEHGALSLFELCHSMQSLTHREWTLNCWWGCWAIRKSLCHTHFTHSCRCLACPHRGVRLVGEYVGNGRG